MLGTAMVHGLGRAGWQVEGIDRSRFDALGQSPAELPVGEGMVVINCAGLINRRQADRPRDEFLLVNGLFPRRLADVCAARGARLVHVSTDCVFDGAAGPYDEAAASTAEDLYGWSKHLGEPANALVIRTSIIGPERSNFYSLLCWFLATRGRCRGYTNHLWNGVTTLELAGAIARLVEAGAYGHGLRHLHGEDLSKLDLLRLMAEAFDHPVEIEPFADPTPRDTRLRSRHPELLAVAAIAPMREQLAALRPLTDAAGHWRG
jgi:dTDP-4-dehydrorhamnose reductase